MTDFSAGDGHSIDRDLDHDEEVEYAEPVFYQDWAAEDEDMSEYVNPVDLPDTGSADGDDVETGEDDKEDKEADEEEKEFGVLKGQSKWSSKDLLELLETEKRKHDLLLARRRELERSANMIAIDRNKKIQAQLNDLSKDFNRIKTQMNKKLKEKLPSKIDNPEVYKTKDEADILEKAAAYLKVTNFIKSTSDQIEVNLETELETEAIELFHRLTKIEDIYLSITECAHLQEYGKGIVAYWECRLREKLMLDFESLLDAFGWPSRLKLATPTLEMHDKFHRSILNLSKISAVLNIKELCQTSLPSTVSHFNLMIEPSTEPFLPLKVMIVPLKRRFKFHFFSDKPTSESSRPEWYFSQVKNWLRDLVPFVRLHLEPVSIAQVGVSSIIEFARDVSEMLMIKVACQLEEHISDGVFVKILEESIAFENEIVTCVGADLANSDTYMPPFVNTIFSRPRTLQRWLEVEKQACWEKLDEMFASPSAWTRHVIPGPAEIVDLFLAVVRFVTDRFAHLKQPGQRIQFLQLVVELLDDFRVRCVQMWKSKTLDQKGYFFKDVLIDYVIADSLYFVECTLAEWEELPVRHSRSMLALVKGVNFFASLAFFMDALQREEEKSNLQLNISSRTVISSRGLSKLNEISDHRLGGLPHTSNDYEGVFSTPRNLFSCLGQEILNSWYQKILSTIAEAAPRGASEKNMFVVQVLKDVVKTVESSMTTKLAEKWVEKLAVDFDHMIMETPICTSVGNSFPSRE